jgi:hypothetical protein
MKSVQIIFLIDEKLYRIDGADVSNPDIIWLEQIDANGNALEDYQEITREKFNQTFQEALEDSQHQDIKRRIKFDFVYGFCSP